MRKEMHSTSQFVGSQKHIQCILVSMLNIYLFVYKKTLQGSFN